MPHLSLRLLGPFQASLDDQPLTGFRSVKNQALLAYLALEADRAHSRAALADASLRPLIDRYLVGTDIDAEQRSRLFRLAWDFTGTALGSRNMTLRSHPGDRHAVSTRNTRERDRAPGRRMALLPKRIHTRLLPACPDREAPL